MNTLTVSLLLWLPFALVFITALSLFVFSGYKRGFWRSLISLGVTAVSAGLSLVLSKLVAGGMAELIMPHLPLEDLDLPFSGELAEKLIQGLIGVIISLMIFSSLLLLFCIIGKTLSNYLGDEKMMPKSAGMQWAGMGIRLVDAVIFSLLLLAPLYGTLATYTPVVQTVIAVTEGAADEISEAGEVMDAITQHPIVTASEEGPVSWVYDGLAETKLGESTLDVADMADSMAGLMQRLDALEKAEGKEALAKSQELIDYLRTDVVDEPWCYELLIRQYLPEMRTSLMRDFTEEEREIGEDFFALCDMPREDFRKNAHAVLGFLEYLLYIDIEEADMETVMETEGFLEKLGKLINTSRQSVGMKNLLIRVSVAEMAFDGNLAQADKVLSLRDVPLEEKDYRKDAEAFVEVFTAENEEQLWTAVSKLP